MKNYLLIILMICALYANAQNESEYLTKKQIKNDLQQLDEILKNTSSYQGLNGFDYKKEFDEFSANSKEQNITKHDFELFLSKVIGKIGDRHSYIKGERVRNSLSFPIAFAPLEDKVLVLDYNDATREYEFWNADFPYLKSINNVPIEKILPKVLPEDVLAPKKSYTLRAVRKLRDIEIIFKAMNFELPNPLPITLANDEGLNKAVVIELVDTKHKVKLWDERFHKNNFYLRDDQSNDKEIIKNYFSIKDTIGYIQLVDMLDKKDSPVFFKFLIDFMTNAEQTNALIIDVRDNGGGTRDLIQEFAGYLVHPDSLYVVNATRQRGKLPLNEKLKKYLHHRFLYSRDELDTREQNAVDRFMTNFKPMYNLDNDNFSEYHYYILNGQKLTKDKYHYNKPIYILTNERSFSAASVFVSVFKDLPNIKIVGVNTDGSSGNSEKFKLSNTEFRGKISTMVSFQKDGQILDGIGTMPDIIIERNLNQILLKEDYQLNKLIEIIKQ